MIISRRIFLTGLASAGTLLCSTSKPDLLPVINSSVPTVEKLARTLDGCLPRVSTGHVYYDHEALVDAYRTIKPTSHVESAIIVWAAFSRRPVTHILEEYCRRRAGASPRMFDHDVLELRGAGLAYTHHLPVFREQVFELVKRITDRDDELTAHKIWLAQLPFHIGEEIGLDDFIDSISDMFRLHYPDSNNEAEQLYHLVQDFYEIALPYSVCSGVVGEALRR